MIKIKLLSICILYFFYGLSFATFSDLYSSAIIRSVETLRLFSHVNSEHILLSSDETTLEYQLDDEDVVRQIEQDNSKIVTKDEQNSRSREIGSAPGEYLMPPLSSSKFKMIEDGVDDWDEDRENYE